MKASKANPIYTAYIIHGKTKYNITPAVVAYDFSEQKKQMAQSVTIDLMNISTKGGGKLSELFSLRDRVYVYADDGSRNDEVFRGYIWTKTFRRGLTDMDLVLKCYDNLIYFQESEVSEYFATGKLSKDVLSTLCSQWGVPLSYSYSSITHSQLALRGTLSDVMVDDVLDLVKERTGKKYVILSIKDVVTIRGVGQNSTVYSFKAGANAINTRVEQTMSGMVTKVVILGKAEDDTDRQPVEATISGNTSQYGTLQKVINRDENTTLADAKKEAQSIIDTDGKPKTEYELQAADVPWIRKGDKVYVDAGDIGGKYLIVTNIDRTITNTSKKMTLTMEEVAA